MAVLNETHMDTLLENISKGGTPTITGVVLTREQVDLIEEAICIRIHKNIKEMRQAVDYFNLAILPRISR